MKNSPWLTFLVTLLPLMPIAAEDFFDDDNYDDVFEDDQTSHVPEEAFLSSHSGVYRKQVFISPLGEKVRLDDGSEWTINPSLDDRNSVKQWMTADKIVIIPNNSWVSYFQYVLVNLSNGDTIQANWITPPLYGGVHHYWIAAIDKDRNKIRLNDGSVWNMSRFSHKSIEGWIENDTVIIGINNGFFNSYNPNILINLEMNSHAIGTCKSE